MDHALFTGCVCLMQKQGAIPFVVIEVRNQPSCTSHVVEAGSSSASEYVCTCTSGQALQLLCHSACFSSAALQLRPLLPDRAPLSRPVTSGSHSQARLRTSHVAAMQPRRSGSYGASQPQTSGSPTLTVVNCPDQVFSRSDRSCSYQACCSDEAAKCCVVLAGCCQNQQGLRKHRRPPCPGGVHRACKYVSRCTCKPGMHTLNTIRNLVWSCSVFSVTGDNRIAPGGLGLNSSQRKVFLIVQHSTRELSGVKGTPLNACVLCRLSECLQGTVFKSAFSDCQMWSLPLTLCKLPWGRILSRKCWILTLHSL